MQIWNYNKKMEITENEDPLNTLVYNAPPQKKQKKQAWIHETRL